MYQVFAALCLLQGASGQGASGGAGLYPNAALLIEPTELAKRLAPNRERNLLVFDCRGEDSMSQGRIPGANRIAMADWAKAFARGDSPEDWAKRLAPLGISDRGHTLVIYDDAMSKDAARVWWILRTLDYPNVKLLNGGWRGWKAAGLPVDSSPFHAPFIVGVSPRAEPKLLRERHADKAHTLGLTRSSAGGTQIIDARSGDEHCGKSSTAKRNGTIPGAKHLEWSDLLDKETHRFKSAEEIRRLFVESGIDVSKPLVTYCQSGGRASVMAFALELMGAKDVRNYYASWAEWGNADDTPVVPGKAKAKP